MEGASSINSITVLEPSGRKQSTAQVEEHDRALAMPLLWFRCSVLGSGTQCQSAISVFFLHWPAGQYGGEVRNNFDEAYS